MLMLGRKLGQSIVIDGKDGKIIVKLFSFNQGQATIGIEAPKSVHIVRMELMDKTNPKTSSVGSQPLEPSTSGPRRALP